MPYISEFTIEANPESLSAEKLALFLDSGINRISIGAQSLNNDKLNRLGRVHDAYAAKECVELAAKKGFKNIGVDLIFGVGGETLESWKDDLEEAVRLPVKHVSAYSLTHDRHLEPVEDEQMAEMYKHAISYLKDSGFKQYEISNFARDGCQCRHNINYWDAVSYKGLGPSAVSYDGQTREENVADLAEYISRSESGKSTVEFSERLSPEDRAKETAAFKIRTMDGIDMEWFERKTGFPFFELEGDAVHKLAEDGLIEFIYRFPSPAWPPRDGHAGDGSGVRLTPKGILLCDIVSIAFL